MSAADKFFGQLLNENLNNLHTSMPCTVVKYYEEPPCADIQPLFSRIAGGQKNNYPMITKAPVLRHVGKLLQGETVFVCFSERALDYAGTRRHDMTDAVIVGVF